MSVLRFNACVVDPARRELTLAGRLVDVQPLIFDLLLFLLHNANRVVTKDEMLKAAWRSTVVSDSVVARAVMKLRRAIGDDAAQARTVLTVHRIGYRLVADVQRAVFEPVLPQAVMPAAPTGAESLPVEGLALTAFENASGDTTIDAVLPELSHVVRHLIGDQVALAAVSDSDALQAWQAASTEPDPLAGACARLRVSELAVVTVLRSAGHYTVRLMRGPDAEHATSVQFADADLLRLANRVADTLAGTAEGVTPAPDSDQAFWQAQYSRAVRLQRTGRAEPALELLQLCRAHLDASPPMLLLQARLHLALGETACAREQIEAAASLAQAEGSPGMTFEAHMAQGEMALAEGHPEAGLQACLQALAGLRAHPQLFGEAPKLIMRFADAMSADSRGTEAIQLAERAVATAQRLGHRSAELSCRLGLGRTLLRFRQLHRASDALRRVVELAQPADDLLKLDGLLLMAEVERAQHRHLSCVDFARQARTLARRAQPGRLAHAMTLELEGMLGAGQTDAVAKLLQQRWGFEGRLDPAAPPSVVLAHSVVMWRQGERDRAVSALKGLLDALPDDTPPAQRTAIAAELGFMSTSAGTPSDTSGWEEHLRGADVWLRTRLGAAQDLSAGRRTAARQNLSEVWFKDGSNPWDSFDTGVDLAWMLIEDGGDDDDLERVIAQVLEMPSDDGAVRLLQSAYAATSDAAERASAQWHRSVTQYPGLLRRHPWLAAGIRKAALPELLTRACY